MGSAINLTDFGWINLSKRWAYFFLFLAAANEVVYRNFSDAVWVNFKLFGIMGLTFIFIFISAHPHLCNGACLYCLTALIGIFEQWINTSKQASVFPNPVSENATLILPKNITVDVFLLSGSGFPLWEDKDIRSDDKDIQVPMSRLPSGFYLLQVVYPNSVQSIKLLKR